MSASNTSGGPERFASEPQKPPAGTPPNPATPNLPQDEGGWRVAPAPDGRGMPEGKRPPPPHRLRGFWMFFIALLAINWIVVLVAQPSQPRVKVPFSPYFLNQVEAGKVKSISSTSDQINGTFSSKVTYPANDAKA